MNDLTVYLREILLLLGVWRDARLALYEHRRIADDDHNGHGKAKCGCWCYDTDAEECEAAKALSVAESVAASNLIKAQP